MPYMPSCAAMRRSSMASHNGDFGQRAESALSSYPAGGVLVSHCDGRSPGGVEAPQRAAELRHGSEAGHTSGMAVVDARRATSPDPRPPRWGFAACRPLDPSHPTFVTCEGTEFEACPIFRGCRPRSASINVRRFAGRQGISRAHSSTNLIYDTRPLFRARFRGPDRRMFNPADELCTESYGALRPSWRPVVEAVGCARGCCG
jgi:hypothetical protein